MIGTDCSALVPEHLRAAAAALADGALVWLAFPPGIGRPDRPLRDGDGGPHWIACGTGCGEHQLGSNVQSQREALTQTGRTSTPWVCGLWPYAYPLFLIRPGIWQSSGECCHGEAGRRGAGHDGGDDPRRHEGERSEVADVPFRLPYSSIGPGRSPGIMKPDGLAFGGSSREPYWV